MADTSGAPLHAEGPVRVSNGLLAGCAAPEDDGVSTFKGIPFAPPPGGARHWRPPVPAPDCCQFTLTSPEPSGLLIDDMITAPPADRSNGLAT